MNRKVALFAVLALQLPNEATAETVVEVGPAFMLRRPGMGVAALWSERRAGWDVGLMVVTQQHLHGVELSTNAGLRITRVVRSGRVELGLGLGYWAHKSAAFSHKQVFELMGGVHLTERVALRFRHYSNAGQSMPNVGQNMVTASWSFQ